MSECMKCHRKLTGDEIGLYRKLIGRDAETFLCKTCLSGRLKIREERLDEKIRQFKKLGCTLFPRESSG